MARRTQRSTLVHEPDQPFITCADEKRTIISDTFAALSKSTSTRTPLISVLAATRDPSARDKKITDQPHPEALPAGIPSQFMKRRPDNRKGEARLIAAKARIGVARAQFLPRVPERSGRSKRVARHFRCRPDRQLLFFISAVTRSDQPTPGYSVPRDQASSKLSRLKAIGYHSEDASTFSRLPSRSLFFCRMAGAMKFGCMTLTQTQALPAAGYHSPGVMPPLMKRVRFRGYQIVYLR